MTNQSYGANGQPLFDDGYPGDAAVDLNLVSNYAASILAAAGNEQASSAYMDLASGWGYDSPAGRNSVVQIGSLHIVTLSVFNATATTIGGTVANMKAGHRPYQAIWVGAMVVDGSTLTSGSAYMAPSGSIGISSIAPDVGSDNKANGLRCQFIFVGG